MRLKTSHLLLLLFAFTLAANAAFAADRPNVIVVMTDDQGYPVHIGAT